MVGACVVGGMCGRGMHGMGGLAGEIVTAADGAHLTEMYSCN